MILHELNRIDLAEVPENYCIWSGFRFSTIAIVVKVNEKGATKPSLKMQLKMMPK